MDDTEFRQYIRNLEAKNTRSPSKQNNLVVVFRARVETPDDKVPYIALPKDQAKRFLRNAKSDSRFIFSDS